MLHSNYALSPQLASFPDLPPFPDTVPTAPLLRISLQRLLEHDCEEEERCWKACCDLGFFYLDLRTKDSAGDVNGEALLQDADQLFEVMKEFFDLDINEKVKYDFADQESYFGYKGYGAGIVDSKGTRDRNEFYNISKDDILALTPKLPAPDILNSHYALYTSYINSSHSICRVILSLLSTHLPLLPSSIQNGGLPALHNLHSISGDQIRFVKAPPQKQDLAVALGEHTDFGSVTVLFNRLGGLQVRLPDYIDAIPPASTDKAGGLDVNNTLCANGWAYVRPLPGHCIVNLGDALVKFSNARLRSNIHRVVAPPKEQGGVTRYSLVYFCRPEDDVKLGCLVEGGEEQEEECVTAKEWILRRALGRRRIDEWEKSGGTEGVSMRGGKK
ncbi:Clavaminate synthase-like protein [Lindgomyces ingoldianus]|uniref:Clavaminate synthase-like protein n=1 Tax=Lindgomyces ingoldianus TaxID=673940 RepID=A0ACB6QRX9_9PLEO|nr:Clavaminate synthase-like protein [Lindgomyces ingoldianus]KAF2469328.1 Clavaminate synthase-like protein [Lindgomyces ingoldianus]